MVQRLAPSTGSAAASRSAAPTPCTERAPIRKASLPAAAQAIEAARKMISPVASSNRVPTRCTKNTSTSAVTATARLYAVTTQETPSSDVWKRV